MFCPKCGYFIENENAVCESCGFDMSKIYEEAKGSDMTENTEENAETGNVLAEQYCQYTLDVTCQERKKISYIPFLLLMTVAVIFIAIILNSNFKSIDDTVDNVNDTSTPVVETAYALIDQGNYDEVLNELADIDTADVEVLKNYIDLLKLKEAFSTACENKQRYETDNYYDSFYNALVRFGEENELHRLPEEYKNDHKCCITAYEFNNRFFNDKNSDGLTLLDTMNNAQNIAFNLIDVNTSSENGNHFKVSDLQTRMDTSQKALDRSNAIESPEVRVEYKDVINACHVDDIGSSYTMESELQERFML